jgi:hypothetical protein
MSGEYPQTGRNTFHQALRGAGAIVANYFKEFGTHFQGSVPDERGLTDRLLLEMKLKGATVHFVRILI